MHAAQRPSGLRRRGLGRGGYTLIAVLAVVLLAGAPLRVAAHPHVFIDARLEFEFDDSGLQGFWAEWAFDELFTSMIVLDFGAPRRGPFSEQLIRSIHEGAFSNLQFYDYFTYVFVDGSRYSTESVEQFSAFMRDHRIVYRFFVPFRYPLDSRNRTLRVRMYDETFFTDIAFERHEPVRIRSDLGLHYDYRVVRNQDVAIEYDNRNQSVRREGAVYSGLTHPYEVVLQYRRP